MNTRRPIESFSDDPAVLSVAFNNDASHFSVGLNTGFCIFHTSSCEVHRHRDLHGGLALVQMMGTTNYLALVGGGRSPKFPQNKVIIWDDKKDKVALEITTLTAVRGVQLSKTRVVVVLQNSVRVYAFEKQPKPLAKYETADNLLGLCALTDKYLIFPGRTAGQVQVVELATENVSIIPAHTSRLQALQLSTDGELLATASEKGTIIRIFSTANCARIAERRRGSDFAQIYSLRFSPSGNSLACTSAKGSLHIFDVSTPGRQNASRTSASPPHSPVPGGAGATTTTGTSAATDSTNKWGFLSSLPFGPFSDVYSFASARFEAGEEPLGGPGLEGGAVLGTTRPVKGVVGWIDENSLIVVGAGRDARWEKFVLATDGEGQRVLVREGWKRYLGN